MEKDKETRGRKKKAEDVKPYSFRFSQKLIADTDDYAEESTQKLGFKVDRTAIIEKAIKKLIYNEQ